MSRPKAATPAPRPKSAFQAVEIIPRRSVLVRFPGGTMLEIPDDRVDLVRLESVRRRKRYERIGS